MIDMRGMMTFTMKRTITTLITQYLVYTYKIITYVYPSAKTRMTSRLKSTRGRDCVRRDSVYLL
jgi:hypothetical protein